MWNQSLTSSPSSGGPRSPQPVRRGPVHRADRDGRAVDRRHRALRSVDTGVVGTANLGFRQASIPPTNWAVENAITALFEKGDDLRQEQSKADENYYAYRVEKERQAEDSSACPTTCRA
jgi:hypothetical protein